MRPFTLLAVFMGATEVSSFDVSYSREDGLYVETWKNSRRSTLQKRGLDCNTTLALEEQDLDYMADDEPVDELDERGNYKGNKPWIWGDVECGLRNKDPRPWQNIVDIPMDPADYKHAVSLMDKWFKVGKKTGGKMHMISVMSLSAAYICANKHARQATADHIHEAGRLIDEACGHDGIGAAFGEGRGEGVTIGRTTKGDQVCGPGALSIVWDQHKFTEEKLDKLVAEAEKKAAMKHGQNPPS